MIWGTLLTHIIISISLFYNHGFQYEEGTCIIENTILNKYECECIDDNNCQLCFSTTWSISFTSTETGLSRDFNVQFIQNDDDDYGDFDYRQIGYEDDCYVSNGKITWSERNEVNLIVMSAFLNLATIVAVGIIIFVLFKINNKRFFLTTILQCKCNIYMRQCMLVCCQKE
jgi:hypothetical protein